MEQEATGIRWGNQMERTHVRCYMGRVFTFH